MKGSTVQCTHRVLLQFQELKIPGGGVLGSIFAGYVPLASPDPYPVIVYSVASYRPHVSHYWANIPQKFQSLYLPYIA